MYNNYDIIWLIDTEHVNWPENYLNIALHFGHFEYETKHVSCDVCLRILIFRESKTAKRELQQIFWYAGIFINLQLYTKCVNIIRFMHKIKT